MVVYLSFYYFPVFRQVQFLTHLVDRAYLALVYAPGDSLRSMSLHGVDREYATATTTTAPFT